MHGGTNMLHILEFLLLALLLPHQVISDDFKLPKPLCYDEDPEHRPTTYVLDCVDLTRKISNFARPRDKRAFAPNSHEGRLLPVVIYQRTCSLNLSWNEVGLEKRYWPPPDWASWDDIAVSANNIISECPWHMGKQRTVGFGGAANTGTHQMIRVEIVGRDSDRGSVIGGAEVIDLEGVDFPEVIADAAGIETS